MDAQHGTFYLAESAEDQPALKLMAGYAYDETQGTRSQFKIGQGLVGQCAQEKRRILVNQVPSDYIRITSSLGEARPCSIVVLPVLFEGEAKAVIELGFIRAVQRHSPGISRSDDSESRHRAQYDRRDHANGGTAEAKPGACGTAAENERGAAGKSATAGRTEDGGRDQKSRSGTGKAALEEKAEQLALTSKYKSEFLANMSHELRTPLNNLLILAQMLAENAENNLQPKQVKYAETIHSSGTDLLALINDILDLSKIESGKMDVEIGSVRFTDLRDYCLRTFRHVAEGKSLEFAIDLDQQRAQRKSSIPTPSVCSRY